MSFAIRKGGAKREFFYFVPAPLESCAAARVQTAGAFRCRTQAGGFGRWRSDTACCVQIKAVKGR